MLLQLFSVDGLVTYLKLDHPKSSFYIDKILFAAYRCDSLLTKSYPKQPTGFLRVS